MAPRTNEPAQSLQIALCGDQGLRICLAAELGCLLSALHGNCGKGARTLSAQQRGRCLQAVREEEGACKPQPPFQPGTPQAPVTITQELLKQCILAPVCSCSGKGSRDREAT